MTDLDDSQDMVMPCPRCGRILEAGTTSGMAHYICPSCNGRQVNIAVLRQSIDPHFINALWQAVRDAPASRHHDALVCPSCRQKMHATDMRRGNTATQLDVCRNCQLLWLDAGEIESLPPPPAFKRTTLRPAATSGLRQSIAENAIRRRQQDTSTSSEFNQPPEYWWQIVFTYLGFPVEEDAALEEYKPWATWTVATLCTLAFLLALSTGLMPSIDAYGFLPDKPWRHGGLTLLTSFFLHGGIFHLVSNLWFLLLVGDNCESILGRARYLMLLATGSVAGLLVHGFLDPRQIMPLVGASAGISALMVFYALSLPKVRLVMCWRLFLYPLWFRITARTAILLWIAIQIVTALMQMQGMTDISGFGHLGGALAGLVAFRWFNPKNNREPAPGDFTDPLAVVKASRRQKQE